MNKTGRGMCLGQTKFKCVSWGGKVIKKNLTDRCMLSEDLQDLSISPKVSTEFQFVAPMGVYRSS